MVPRAARPVSRGSALGQRVPRVFRMHPNLVVVDETSSQPPRDSNAVPTLEREHLGPRPAVVPRAAEAAAKHASALTFEIRRLVAVAFRRPSGTVVK